MTPAERDEILRAHNKYRDEVGVPHLEWDENLATGAQQQYWQQSAQVWADHLASLSSIPVSPHSSSTAIGESIAWGTAGAHTIGQLIDQTWGAEKRYFIYAPFDMSETASKISCTGNWQKVGHYTQMVWEHTTKVGCGWAHDGGGNDILVCRYNPPGNSLGQSVFSQPTSIFKRCKFITDRSNFGRDEILAMFGAPQAPKEVTIPNAFYVVVDCFHPEWLGITAAKPMGKAPSITLSPPVSGMTARPTTCSPENPMLPPEESQRFTWTYDVVFTDPNVSGFPQGLQEIEWVTLTASITSTTGITVTDQAVIALTSTAQPYEIDGAVSWLSTDLRVFKINAGESMFGALIARDNPDPNAFITGVIDNLNRDDTGGQTFNDIPDQQLELLETVGETQVFNFAVARVRYCSSTLAPNVSVFFRLFPVATTSLEYDRNTAYRRYTEGETSIPLLGIKNGEVVTIPCFASKRIESVKNSMAAQSMTEQHDEPNIGKTLPASPTPGTEVVHYFGCWLDINQTKKRFPIQTEVDGPYEEADSKSIQQLVRNQHQCLVTEISLNSEPIITSDQTPATSDKLAQRNLAIIESANPGDIASHRILQTFDIRPTAASLPSNQMPDELMIDWGDVPTDSKANIYLPGTSADTILAMAVALYARHGLSRVDDYTLACQARGITYIPIPPGVGSNFAGLLTIDLPATVRDGQAFRVITRQITNASFAPIRKVEVSATAGGAAKEDVIRWRQTVGTFQITIPVSTKEALLKPALRQLAVFKYIAQTIPVDNRWSPVFGRYLRGLGDRVRALGGNPEAVLPSPAGDVQNGKPFAKDVPYIGTWLVLGPIFDPAHQPGSHLGDVPPRPSAGEIILDIDNHKDQLDPLVLTTLGRSPGQDDVVRYGGRGADGKTVLTERVYTWRERYFGGLDWNNFNDIKDDVHTHLGGDYDDDPFDPYNYLNFAGKHHALALLLVYIISPDDRTTRIALRHDDAVRVWLNGEEIRNDALPFLLDQDIIAEDETFAEITLRSGTNVLLVAVAETHTDWGFSARIEDYHGLRITADRPGRDPIMASESQYHSVSIAGSGNLWYAYDLNRALTCAEEKKWKGRIKIADEHFKIVGHRHHWIPDWWGPGGLDIFLDNFHNEVPGVYDIIFFEDDPIHPVLILVKPFVAR